MHTFVCVTLSCLICQHPRCEVKNACPYLNWERGKYVREKDVTLSSCKKGEFLQYCICGVFFNLYYIRFLISRVKWHYVLRLDVFFNSQHDSIKYKYMPVSATENVNLISFSSWQLLNEIKFTFSISTRWRRTKSLYF